MKNVSSVNFQIVLVLALASFAFVSPARTETAFPFDTIMHTPVLNAKWNSYDSIRIPQLDTSIIYNHSGAMTTCRWCAFSFYHYLLLERNPDRFKKHPFASTQLHYITLYNQEIEYFITFPNRTVFVRVDSVYIKRTGSGDSMRVSIDSIRLAFDTVSVLAPTSIQSHPGTLPARNTAGPKIGIQSSRGRLRFKAAGHPISEITVYDAMGRIAWNWQGKATRHVTWKNSLLPAGTYVGAVNLDGRMARKRFLILR